MKRIAQALLTFFARRVVRRYHPHVVGITGSYGKTSAKEAIAVVLSHIYDIQSSAGSFNNEFGVPFTVLGAPTAKGVPGWRRVAVSLWHGAQYLVSHKPYPPVLVLEMGADKPGDIEAILGIVPLSVGVITSVGPTHLHHFGSVENVLAEKSLIATRVAHDGWIVLNGDDPRVRSLADVSPASVISFGFSGGVAVRCIDAAVVKGDSGEHGLMIKVLFNRETVSVFIPGVVGIHSAYAALAGIAVGIAFHMDFPDIVAALSRYTPPPGRMRVLSGVKNTTLIDDSYNSSPDACTAALETLRSFPAEGKRYALLGEMADLGASTEPAHREIGRKVVENCIDVFVGVGEAMKHAASEARKAGMDEDHIFSFDDPVSAAKLVHDRFTPGDTALIKGSQIARMEKAVKELMADPERAEELLVRQDTTWLTIP
ncbi:MAG: UDP-N-acetylmuramoyl-tripeptide--D-alanyl-D-alanine ligase [Candidatus Kerfeldbacteria bacterium]